MSDLFVNNIDNDTENLAALEDNDIELLETENSIGRGSRQRHHCCGSARRIFGRAFTRVTAI